MSPGPELSQEVVRQQVMEALRGLDRRHHDQWSWAGQFRKLSRACGLQDLENGEVARLGPVFQREMHRLIPVGAYSTHLAGQLLDPIVSIVRRVHAQGAQAG